MAKTSATATLKNGLEFETVFYSNPKKESPFRFRATHIDGKRAPKVILCDDPRLLSACPHCAQALKFNPFFVDRQQ